MLERYKMPMVAALLCVPFAANAATLSPGVGAVLVSKGEGFVGIAGDTAVSPGDQVMVRAGGRATITYSSDCIVPVTPGLISVVQTKAPCTKGSLAKPVALQSEPAPIENYAGLGSLKDGVAVAPVADPGIAPALVGLAGVGVGLGIAFSDNGGHAQVFPTLPLPASP